MITVAVDCMGGDHGPHVTVPAALEFQARLPDVELILVGLQDRIQAELKSGNAAGGARVRVQPAFPSSAWMRSGKPTRISSTSGSRAWNSSAAGTVTWGP